MNQLFPLALAALCLTAPASAQITSFQHVVVVVQENRTPDNMFQGLCPKTTPSACSTQPSSGQYNIQTTGWLDKTSPGTHTTNPTAVRFGTTYDVLHRHSAFVQMCDFNKTTGACAMDGAALVPCQHPNLPCPKKPALEYVDNSAGVLNPYLDLVKAYGWGNYMFQTNQGASFPAHEYLFGATSAPSWKDDHNGIFVAENTLAGTGCDAPINSRVQLINPQGVEFTTIFPCLEHRTLADLLGEQGTSWRYYGVVGPLSFWMAPNAIKHICVAVNGKCTGEEFTKNVDINPPDVLSDISACALRSVSWVTPEPFDSDHAGDLRNTGGPSWVASIVNAVGNNSTCKNPDGSSYWESTAIIIVWDDWGGWYDHEAPTFEPYPQGGYQMGFRVPLIVVSAYNPTPKGFISNTREDFGSIVRFIERNFGILEGKLTFADKRSTTDLTEFFSLGNPPRPFQPINAPLSAKHFLSEKPSGLPVDDD